MPNPSPAKREAERGAESLTGYAATTPDPSGGPAFSRRREEGFRRAHAAEVHFFVTGAFAFCRSAARPARRTFALASGVRALYAGG